jgi:Cu-Zn family superoxide dismutase
VNHGAPDAPVRHIGDLGNIVANAQGNVNIDFTDSIVRLSGNESVLGRAFVVHATVDDLGLGGNSTSLTTGNSGPRVACGVIKEITQTPNKSNQLRMNQSTFSAFAIVLMITYFINMF